jgi:hypothetical protein
LTGARALLLVWGLWGFCLLAAPVSPRFDADPFSVSLLVCANVALLIGLGIGSLWKRQSAVPESNHLRYAGRAIDLVIIALIGLGLIAIVARQIDYFVIRHVSVGACIEEVRGQLALAGPNFMSLIFALLIPAGVAAGILGLATLLQRRALGAGCSIGVSALLVFALAAIPALLMRSRSPLFLLLAMALVTALLAAPRLSWRGALLAGSATLTTFLVMMLLFLSREFQCDQIPDLGDLVEHSRLSLLVPVRSYVLDAIRAADPWLAKLIYALVSVVQYVLHGVFSFFRLVAEKNPNDPLLLGRFEFVVFDKLRQVLLHVPPPDLEIYNPRTRQFTTFWGPAYIDFGYFMIVYGFVFGLVVDFFRRRVERGDIFALPLYVLLLVQVMMVPVANGLQMGDALYMNIGLFGLWIAARALSPRLAHPD